MPLIYLYHQGTKIAIKNYFWGFIKLLIMGVLLGFGIRAFLFPFFWKKIHFFGWSTRYFSLIKSTKKSEKSSWAHLSSSAVLHANNNWSKHVTTITNALVHTNVQAKETKISKICQFNSGKSKFLGIYGLERGLINSEGCYVENRA